MFPDFAIDNIANKCAIYAKFRSNVHLRSATGSIYFTNFCYFFSSEFGITNGLSAWYSLRMRASAILIAASH